MKAQSLTWKIIYRSAIWSIYNGALMGGVYGASIANIGNIWDGIRFGMGIDRWEDVVFLVLLCLYAAAIGSIVGALLAITTGPVVGMIIGFITYKYFSPMYDIKRYSYVIRITSVLFSTIVVSFISLLFISLFFPRLPVIEVLGRFVQFSLMPALLAGIAAFRTSNQFLAWYKTEL
jgi:hypothetical protein